MGSLTQFACTACGKTLRSPTPVPEGKKIKCPKCAQVFAVTGNTAAAPPRTGGDLNFSTAPARRTSGLKRKRSNPFVMWGTCFIVSLIFTLIAWIPARLAIGKIQSAAPDIQNKDKGFPKDAEKDMLRELEKQMQDKGFPDPNKGMKDADGKDKMNP